MIKEWIEEYKPSNKEQAEQAMREIMQEVALAGLQRTGFFEKAAFYGGIRAQDSGDLEMGKISKEEFIKLVKTKIDSVSFKNIKEDIVRFIPDDKVLDIWSPEYFSALVDKMKFK